MTIEIILPVLILSVYLFSMLRISRISGRIHSQFDLLEQKAQKASTVEQLQEVYSELIQFYRTSVPGHRHFATRATEIAAFIRGRLNQNIH
jgi:hypothetical protein